MLDYVGMILRHGRIDPVEYYTCHSHRVIYVENAKVACTAIKRTLFPDVRYASLGQEEFHRRLRGRASLSPPSEMKEYHVFSVFRHPVDRLTSCYRDKVLRDAATPSGSIFGRRFHRTLFTLFAGVDITAGNLEFERFASAVGKIPDRLSDRHFAAQTKVYQAVSSASHYSILRMENLADDWADLRAATGLPELERTNESLISAPGQRFQVAPETRAAIQQRYASDFRLLGYEPAG